MSDSDEYSTVNIPKSLIEKINKRIKNEDFNSASEYITYLLREFLSSVEEEEQDKKDAVSEENKEKVDSALREIGYIK